MQRSLDDVVRNSLTRFAEEVLAGSWRGRREREAVSLYAFGCLLKEVHPAGFLKHPAQISIECPVPQIADGPNVKRQVCKDLVLWPEPGMTCWDDDGLPTVPPASILEWKLGVCVSVANLGWLSGFAERYRDFIGYAVTANPPDRSFVLNCTRVASGTVERDWLLL